MRAGAARSERNEVVAGGEAGQSRQHGRWHAGPQREALRRRTHMFPYRNTMQGSAHARDCVHRGATQRCRDIILRHRAIQRTGDVGQHDRDQAEGLCGFHHPFDVAGGLMHTGQQVDLLVQRRRSAARFDDSIDDGTDGFRPAVFQCTIEIRRIGQNHTHIRQFGTAREDQFQVASDILATRFHQRRGGDTDEARLHALGQIEQRFFQILRSAHHRCDFVDRGGLHRNGFLGVTDGQHQGEGRAALRAMQQRHRPRDTQIRQRGAKRGGGFQRVGGKAFAGMDDLGHGTISTLFRARPSVPPRGRWLPTARGGALPATRD